MQPLFKKNTYKASHTGEKRIIYEHSELLEATLNQRLMARRLRSLRRRGNVFRFALFHARDRPKFVSVTVFRPKPPKNMVSAWFRLRQKERSNYGVSAET